MSFRLLFIFASLIICLRTEAQNIKVPSSDKISYEVIKSDKDHNNLYDFDELIKNDKGNIQSIIALLYASSESHYGDLYPCHLGELIEYGFASNPLVLTAPISYTPVPKRGGDILIGHCDYMYFGNGWSIKDYPPDRPLICTKPGLLVGGFINVGYKDLSVKTYKQIPDNIAEIINEEQNRILDINRPVRGYLNYNDLYNSKLSVYEKSCVFGIEHYYYDSQEIKYENITNNTNFSRKINRIELSLLYDIFNIIERDRLYEYKEQVPISTKMGTNANVPEVEYNISGGKRSISFKTKYETSAKLYPFRSKIEILFALVRNSVCAKGVKQLEKK